MPDTFIYTSPLDDRAQPLVEQLTHEYSTRYGTYFGETAGSEMSRYPPEVFAEPDGAFILLLRDGETIAGGAFMRFDEETAEFKRIWTHVDYRRQGLSRRVMSELEKQAVRQGYSRVYLTTGFRQPEATNLYLTSGYIPQFDPRLDPALYGKLPFKKTLVERAGVIAFPPVRASQPASAGRR